MKKQTNIGMIALFAVIAAIGGTIVLNWLHNEQNDEPATICCALPPHISDLETAAEIFLEALGNKNGDTLLTYTANSVRSRFDNIENVEELLAKELRSLRADSVRFENIKFGASSFDGVNGKLKFKANLIMAKKAEKKSPGNRRF